MMLAGNMRDWFLVLLLLCNALVLGITVRFSLFAAEGERHTSAEAQCDCESENEIRRHIGLRERACDYGTCPEKRIVLTLQPGE